MNAATMMQTCPSEETLAAFLDGRLDPTSRLDVIQHLADCGDCRDIVVAANEYASSDQVQGAGTVVRGRFGTRVLAPVAAAAAVVALVLFGVPSIRERLPGGDRMAPLVKAADALPERTTEARLSGNFAYKDHRSMRGAAQPANAEYALQAAVLRAAERAEKKPSPANLHAAGVGGILWVDMNDRSAAVRILEQAANADPNSAAIQTDLAAAYLARGGKNDYENALAAAEKAWRLEQLPAAAWNRALALDRLGRDAEAIAAWRQYLSLDSDSPWATEARQERLNDLTQQP